MLLDYTALKPCDLVAVARTGSWGIMNEGHYFVVKANKVRVVVERACDGHQRVFSVRRREEITRDNVGYHTAFLESVEEQDRRIKKKIHEQAVCAAWKNLEHAGRDRSLQSVRAALQNLESLMAE